MFDLRTVLIAGPIFVFVLWIVLGDDKYADLVWFKREMWTKASVRGTIAVSIPVLFLCLFLFPWLQGTIASSMGSLASNPEATGQVQVEETAVGVLGKEIGLLLTGFLLGTLGGMEEVIHRGIIMRFVTEKSNWVAGLAVSILTFSLFHLTETGFSPSMVIYAAIAGLIFGLVYRKVGLLGAVLVHFGVNFVPFIVLLLWV